MARLMPAPVDVYGPLFGDAAPLRLQVYANRPELARAFLAFGNELRENRLLSDRLLELVRLRVAFWNQCRSCMAVRYEESVEDGLTEALVCSIERPEEAPDLTEAERAALSYADLAANNHLAISDETFDKLREHFTEPEIMELLFNVGLFVGLAAWATRNMVDDLPDRTKRSLARHPGEPRRTKRSFSAAEPSGPTASAVTPFPPRDCPSWRRAGVAAYAASPRAPACPAPAPATMSTYDCTSAARSTSTGSVPVSFAASPSRAASRFRAASRDGG